VRRSGRSMNRKDRDRGVEMRLTCIQCHPLFVSAVTHIWQLRAFNRQTWSGSRRQRRLQRIRFIVEKERSTVAVPTGSRSSLRTAVENAGNMATLSAESARFSILPVVSRSPGKQLESSIPIANPLQILLSATLPVRVLFIV